MSIDFSKLTGWSTSKGAVTQVVDSSGKVIWMLNTASPIILEVEKKTSNTYAGETTYNNEEFILLDIYPKTNGTVNVTYGGLTKTIADTSGAAEPNAQQVFFGTFNGVSDGVATPASGTLTIEGDCYAFASGSYAQSNKSGNLGGCKVTEVKSFGNVTKIPDVAFQDGISCGLTMSSIEIPDTIKSIGKSAFYGSVLEEVTISKNIAYIGYLAFGGVKRVLKTVKINAIVPPEIGTTTIDGVVHCRCFMPLDGVDSSGNPYFTVEKIIVPKGCGEAYKVAQGFAEFADYIVEAS